MVEGWQRLIYKTMVYQQIVIGAISHQKVWYASQIPFPVTDEFRLRRFFHWCFDRCAKGVVIVMCRKTCLQARMRHVV